MNRRLLVITLGAALALSLSGCTNKKVQNPIADVNSKQPDKVLFDRSMDAMKHNKFDVARMTLQTLINTYPDSEFVARAKLAVGDSWYAEGGTAALQQAEAEYKDFQTFFPNMVNEASEAQYKIANIHYNQMEKADRDFTHAKRAEEEFRYLILQYPDSPLVPKAKSRLREVQEVLAEREYQIGRFYYLRESWAAAIARLKTMTDTYPLYSNADDALYMLGDAYMRQVDILRASRLPEARKGKLIADYQNAAAEAFSKIAARYPMMERAGDAKARLTEMKRPIPSATPEAVAANKAELESRSKLGTWGRTMLTFHKRPDVSEAAKVGEPTLVDPHPTNAPEISKHAMDVLTGKEEKKEVSVEKIGTGTPAENQPVPRSDNAVDPNAGSQDNGIDSLTPISGGGSSTPAASSGNSSASATATAVPAESTTTAPQAPTQVNEMKTEAAAPASVSNDNSKEQVADNGQSSSKKKKKKGLGKINPF